jgi:hypothetical protein
MIFIFYTLVLFATKMSFASTLFSYTVVTKGDLLAECSDFLGKTAVGRDAYLRDFLIKNDAKQGCPIEVSGLLKMTRGSISTSQGFTCARAQSHELDRSGVKNIVNYEVDFQTLNSQMNETSLALANVATGSNQVYNLHPSDIKVGSNLILKTKGSESLIINMHGTSFSFDKINIELQGTAKPSNIIWNFYEATSVKMKRSGVKVTASGENIGFPGTILAPYAEVTLNNILISGAVFASSVVGMAEARNCTGMVSGQVNPVCFKSNIRGVGCGAAIRRGKGGHVIQEAN